MSPEIITGKIILYTPFDPRYVIAPQSFIDHQDIRDNNGLKNTKAI